MYQIMETNIINKKEDHMARCTEEPLGLFDGLLCLSSSHVVILIKNYSLLLEKVQRFNRIHIHSIEGEQRYYCYYCC